ncbi:MAG: hypothetical protein ACYDHM_13710 [Acidiferrobacterales bacterium]
MTEYYAIRIYRRTRPQARPGVAREVQLTGQLEDDAGHKEPFHSAEELWRLLVKDAPEKPLNGD